VSGLTPLERFNQLSDEEAAAELDRKSVV